MYNDEGVSSMTDLLELFSGINLTLLSSKLSTTFERYHIGRDDGWQSDLGNKQVKIKWARY